MGLRFKLAKALGAATTWGLQRVFHRPASNFPGKAGLAIDPNLMAHLLPRIRAGTIVVVGTNGKTTVTNLLADAFEHAGKSVACNRTGANLDSGVATALLHAQQADWGIFESDELWLPRITPQLKPDFVVLLNLFRDQLDRMGEIDHIQEAVARALTASPQTTLVYNADDPLCQAIANLVENECIAFGIEEDLCLAQNTVSDASMCQRCDSLLIYEWRQYGQLGAYECPACGFKRPQPDFLACNVVKSQAGVSFKMRARTEEARINVPFPETYMLYNALATCTAASCCKLSPSFVDDALAHFDHRNGRLQNYLIAGHQLLLNLAKNPIGFNQNLKTIQDEPGPKAAAFFINDREADGHDVSWLWDVDFQELSDVENLEVFAGGIRRNDLQVRLKYAGIDARLIDDAKDFLVKAHGFSAEASLFAVANYTALPDVKDQFDRLQNELHFGSATHLDEPHSRNETDFAANSYETTEKLTIVHMYPELLNLYGDSGNVVILAERGRARGIEVEIIRVSHGQYGDYSMADIVFLGGGPDREQHLASLDLLEQAEELRNYVEDDGVLLSICGGFQILGHEWLAGDESIPGLGILDITTKRVEGGSHNRIVGNIALSSTLANMPVIGYENHAGRTFLGGECEPFGLIIGKNGKGNNDEDGADGARYRNVVGTYLHGPLLAKNPEIADWLLDRALARRAVRNGYPASTPLMPLDDSVEREANAFMCAKLGIANLK